jgi:GntR family transcriptional repressor for pyruvate dehydrogenase complex
MKAISLSHSIKLNPVKKKKLYEDIVAQIQYLIEKGRLKSGDQLPPERELAEVFNVSRNSVREAIRTLEGKKILEIRPGDGTYVIINSETSIIGPLATAIHNEKNKLSEIFQFRRMIEPQIAHLASENASASDIRKLEKILNDQKKEIKEGEKTKELDSAFHLMLARASNNKILLRIIQTLNEILGETREEILQTEERRQKSFNGHANILRAIKQKQTKSARNAMNDHLNDVEEIVINQKLKRPVSSARGGRSRLPKSVKFN